MIEKNNEKSQLDLRFCNEKFFIRYFAALSLSNKLKVS